jgi:two-component system KDP operon response regulator KdpE
MRFMQPRQPSSRTPAGGRPRIGVLSGPLLGNLSALVLAHLEAECRAVATRPELRSLLAAWAPELVLADLDLHPEAPEWTRVDGIEIPCIGLTRRREAVVKIEAFDRGVHDVIEVPFTPDEIVVRARAALTRAHGRKPELRPRVRVGEFEMDLVAGAVLVDSRALKLSPLDQTLLYLFLANPGAVLSRESILTDVWGTHSALTSNVIDRHIRDLRVKLGESWRQPRFIETVAGEGYRYIGEAVAPLTG